MIWKNALKYPVLVIGLVLFTLFLMDPKTAIWWDKQMRRYIPSTCDAIVDRSGKKLDQSWELECPGTKLLLITIPYEEKEGEAISHGQEWRHFHGCASAKDLHI